MTAMRQKRSDTTGYTWTGADLLTGQVGVNMFDGTLHLLKSVAGGGGYITISGDAAQPITSVANGVDNRLSTFTGANGLNGEANLTFDGTLLTVAGNLTVTSSGVVTLAQDPTANLHAATKQYVDAVAAGITSKPSCRVATAAALPAYTQAGAGVGATLTADAVGILTVDGVATLLDDRILVKDGTGADLGIYDVTVEGTAGVAFELTRATDADTTAELDSAHVFVNVGTTNSDTSWVQTATVTTVDTTSQVWAQFSSAGQLVIANVGSGADVWRDRVGNTDSLRGLNSVDTKLTIAVNADNIDFTVNEANLTITESQISDLQSYLVNVVEDLTPELGGDLNVNSQSIVSTGGLNVTITPDVSGVAAITRADISLGARLDVNDFFIQNDADGVIRLGGTNGARTKLLDIQGTRSAVTGDRSYLIQENATLEWDAASSGTNRNRSRVSTFTQDVNGFSSGSASRFHGVIGHMMSSYAANTGAAAPSIDWHMGLMGDAEMYNDVDVVNSTSVVGYFFNGGTGTATNHIAFEAVFDSTATNNWALKCTEATADIEIAGQLITAGMTFPAADSGVAGYVLSSDAAGTLSWVDNVATDATAIHNNVANEITAITAKTTPVGADEILIEDSAAGFVKKSVTLANLLDDGQF